MFAPAAAVDDAMPTAADDQVSSGQDAPGVDDRTNEVVEVAMPSTNSPPAQHAKKHVLPPVFDDDGWEEFDGHMSEEQKQDLEDKHPRPADMQKDCGIPMPLPCRVKRVL